MPDDLLGPAPPAPKRSRAGAAARLLRYVFAEPAAMLGVFVASAIGTVLSLVAVGLVGWTVQEGLVEADRSSLARGALGILGAAVASWLATSAGGYLMAGAAQEGMFRLRRDLFEHVQTLSLRFYDRQPIGELMSRILNDLDSVGQFFDKGLFQLVNSLLMLVATVIFMFVLSWQMTIAVLLIVPFVLGLMVFTSRFAGPAFATLQDKAGAYNGAAEEAITGDRVLKAYLAEGASEQRLDAISVDARDAGTRANFLSLVAQPVAGMLGNLDVALVALAGGYYAIERDLIDLGTVTVFLLLSRMFTRPLTQLAQLSNLMLAATAGARRVFEILDERSEIVDRPGAAPIPSVHGKVDVAGIGFAYETDLPILRDVSLAARPGQKIGLCGPTGAGKSTIVNLITRYYDVQEGDIAVDGVSVYDVLQESLRGEVGMVLQEPYLFTDTVMANLRYARLDATDAECIEASKRANAHAFVERLPDGYDTVLEGGGAALSQGQRQLLTIARVILADRPILILDEATSSVDTRTEQRIQEALRRLMTGRTSFVIAHRLSTIRDADVIVALDHGEVVDAGSHDELMAKGGFYRTLYLSQFKTGIFDQRV
jgi:ATP-binding cassette subfamily B protein